MTERPPVGRLAALVAVLLSMLSLCVGSSYAKSLFPVLGAAGTAALRVGFAAVVLVLLWRPWRLSLAAAERGTILRYGLVLGLMNLLFYLAIARIPVGLAVAIEFMGPLGLAMLSSRKILDWAWVALAALGLGLLLPLQGGSSLDLLGVLAALGAGLCWALYILAGQAAGRLPAGQATALGMVVATAVTLPVGLGQLLGPLSQQPALLLSGLVVGVLSSAIPYSLEMVALRALPKHTFSILLSLEPAIGALVALVMLHEGLAARQWVAILFVTLASMGSTLGSRPAPLPQAQP